MLDLNCVDVWFNTSMFHSCSFQHVYAVCLSSWFWNLASGVVTHCKVWITVASQYSRRSFFRCWPVLFFSPFFKYFVLFFNWQKFLFETFCWKWELFIWNVHILISAFSCTDQISIKISNTTEWNSLLIAISGLSLDGSKT